LNRIIARAPLALAFALAAPVAGLAQTSAGNGASAPPAWEAFKKANDSIKDYTETITAHEVKGSDVQDRVYHFSFAKPAFARSAIVSGPGSGGEAVWTGGDHVRGHQGGFLKMIKLSIPIDDARATDLRGKTIDAAFFPTIIASFESGGPLSEEPGPIVDGAPTDAVSHVPSDPTKVRGLTKDVFLISRTTHLPVEHLGYEGSQLVEDDKFTDQKINPGLPPSTFQM
jgi:hypothetical protein